jgi:hypothetical protein
MKEKMDVRQGTLALMVLKTVAITGRFLALKVEDLR